MYINKDLNDNGVECVKLFTTIIYEIKSPRLSAVHIMKIAVILHESGVDLKDSWRFASCLSAEVKPGSRFLKD